MDIDEDYSPTKRNTNLKRLRKSTSNKKSPERIYSDDTNTSIVVEDKSSLKDEGAGLGLNLASFSCKRDLSRNRTKVEYIPMQPKKTPPQSQPLPYVEPLIEESQSIEPKKEVDKTEAAEVLMSLGKKKKKVSNTKSGNNNFKNEIKERQIAEVSGYLFNYLKDARADKINKGSLAKCLHALNITSITDDEATKMMNFPNEDPSFTKKDLSLEDVKDIVRLCNFKFDSDNRLL